jgi:hypothetical protein
MSKRCPRCQQENRDQARFCINCNYAFMDQQAPARMCPAGRHVMDPGWSACPYCSGGQEEQAAQGRAPTVPESAERHSDERKVPPQQAGASRRKTEFGDGSIRPDEAPTVRGLQAQTPARRIAAIMVSYSWRADGEVHPIREGRNYIGSDADCEVCVKDDPQMSARHATIIHRGKGTQFIIDDEKSMNGTYLDDKSVDVKQPLHNYAKVRTGATTWTFIMLDPEEAAGE